MRIDETRRQVQPIQVTDLLTRKRAEVADCFYQAIRDAHVGKADRCHPIHHSRSPKQQRFHLTYG